MIRQALALAALMTAQAAWAAETQPKGGGRDKARKESSKPAPPRAERKRGPALDTPKPARPPQRGRRSARANRRKADGGLTWKEGLADALAAAGRAGYVRVEAEGWRPRRIEPDRIARVWNLPVRFSSFQALARRAKQHRLKTIQELKRPVTLDFAKTPFRDVIAFLRDFTGLSIQLSPSVGAAKNCPITLKVQDMPLDKALDFITQFAGVSYRVVDGMIVMGKWKGDDREARLAVDSLDAPAFKKLVALLDRPVTLHFHDTPLSDVTAFLGESILKETNLVLDSRGLPEPMRRVSLKTNAAPLADTLDLLCRQYGLRAQIVGAALVFSTDPRIVEHKEATRVMSAEDLALRSAYPLSPAAQKIAASLQKPATIDCSDTPLPDIVTFLADFTSTNIVLDPLAAEGAPPVSLKVDCAPMRSVLDLLCAGAGAAYRVKSDAIFITMPDQPDDFFGLGADPLDPSLAKTYKALQAALEKPVTLDFADTPLKDVRAFLADYAKVNIVVDPLAFLCSEESVTLKVRNMPLKNALELLAYLTDSHVVLWRGVVLFTNDAAAQIRRHKGSRRVGAGVIVRPGYALTCLDTVDCAKRIWVTAPGGKPKTAQAVHIDKTARTALLKIAGP